MIDRKHTHRGTCQACGAVQAVDNSTRLMAKHGYTVDWGFFSGVCSGAGEQPMEESTVFADATIKRLMESHIPSIQKSIDQLIAGEIEPPEWYKYVNFRSMPARRDELTDGQRAKQVGEAIVKARRALNGTIDHIARLRSLKESRFGQDLYAVKREERKVLAAGSKVRIGGKSGWVGTVREVKYMIARGCGPYLNGQNILHAIVTHENGKEFSIPVRTIRQDAIL